MNLTTNKLKKLEEYLSWEFSSSPTTGEDFLNFSRLFKKRLQKLLSEFELVKYHQGHYYVSAFFKRNNKYVYISIPDVRFNQNGWYNNILIRTAKDENDYTGGSNNFVSLKQLHDIAIKLTE